MDIKEKIKEIKFCINRFDHYYDSVNNKGNLYLAINTFILGGVITGYFSLNSQYHFKGYILILLIIVFISNLISAGYTLLAIKPFLKKKNGTHSMIFFVDVAESSDRTINNFWNNLNEEKLHEDMLLQYKILAEGLKRKFIWLQKATSFIAVEVAGLVLFGIVLLFKS